MSLISQYAGGRSQLPFVSANLAVSNSGATTVARTLSFCLQAENVVGHTLPSSILGPYTINVGERLTLTLTNTVRKAGESWLAYSLSASLTNTPSSFVQVARIPAYDTSHNLASFPLSIVLATDNAFQLSQTVPTASDLPLINLIAGMRRGVYDLGYVFEYDPTSILTVNGVSVLTAPSSPGRWLRVGSFSNFIDDETEPGGSAQDLRNINELVVKYPRYACNGNDGQAMGFWLKNTDTAPIPSGQRILITVLMNEIVRSGTFEGLLRATFKGYVNTNDGTLRTTNANGTLMRGRDTPILFENKKTDLIFEDDLQSGEAYWLEVLPNFIPSYLNFGVANHSLIAISCTIAAQAGAFVEGGDAQGNRIYAKYDLGLAVPIKGAAVRVLKRSGIVNSRSFLAIAPTTVSPFTFNTAGQRVRINGNGAVYRGTGSLLDTEATRAVVELLPGTSAASPLSSPVVINATQGLQVTVTYPSNGTNATIRANYPDPLLAGNTKAELNPLFVTLYVQLGSVLKRFVNLLLIDGPTQTFDVSDWNGGEVISSIPNAPNLKFCPFAALSAIATPTSVGSYPLGSVRVAYAFQYDGTTVSALSHARADGCLYTSTLDWADLESSTQYWGPPVLLYADLPTLNVLIGQVRAVNSTGKLYRWNGTTWEFAAQPEYWGEPVANKVALPLPASVLVGQVRLTLDTGSLYRCTGIAWKLASGGGGSSGVLNSWRFN